MIEADPRVYLSSKLFPGERLLADLWCGCGYNAVCFCSAGWDGPTPIPTHCPDCGAPLFSTPSGRSGDASEQ